MNQQKKKSLPRLYDSPPVSNIRESRRIKGGIYLGEISTRASHIRWKFGLVSRVAVSNTRRPPLYTRTCAIRVRHNRCVKGVRLYIMWCKVADVRI